MICIFCIIYENDKLYKFGQCSPKMSYWFCLIKKVLNSVFEVNNCQYMGTYSIPEWLRNVILKTDSLLMYVLLSCTLSILMKYSYDSAVLDMKIEIPVAILSHWPKGSDLNIQCRCQVCVVHELKLTCVLLSQNILFLLFSWIFYLT